MTHFEHNYPWDAENHLKSANGVNYTYDGDLRRVEKSNGKLYWYSTSGQILEETDLSGNLISDYVYFAGKRVGRRDASGTVYSYVTDPLGTTKGIISSGALCYDADFYPFGGERGFTPIRARRTTRHCKYLPLLPSTTTPFGLSSSCTNWGTSRASSRMIPVIPQRV